MLTALVKWTSLNPQLLSNWYSFSSGESVTVVSSVKVNLCQKLLFLHQLTHNMTTDCSLNYKFNTWKFQAQTWGEHIVYRNCFWHSEQICTQYVLPMFFKRRASDKDLPLLSRAIKIVKWKKQLARKVNSRLDGHEKIKMVSFSLIIMLGTVLTFNKLMT